MVRDAKQVFGEMTFLHSWVAFQCSVLQYSHESEFTEQCNYEKSFLSKPYMQMEILIYKASESYTSLYFFIFLNFFPVNER